MPFIKQERRKIIDQQGLKHLKDIQVGDRCYVFYKEMVKRWKENPCWTTAHKIYQDSRAHPVWTSPDTDTAYDLAWQVFFIKYVIPYENQKEIENGTIQLGMV